MQVASDGSTAVQPAVDGAVVQVASDGSTAVQPAVDGAAMQVASDGSTAVQPAVDGAAVQVASDGSTAVQPAVDGAAVQVASDGSTLPQNVSDGSAMHWSSDGQFWYGKSVRWDDTVLPLTSVMESPAVSDSEPVVVTTALLLTMSLSVVLPLEPATSVILPPPLLVTDPLIVKGLCASIAMAPASVETGPTTVTAPVLLMLIPPEPWLGCDTAFTVNVPVLFTLMSALAPVLDAVRLLTWVMMAAL